MMSASGKSGKGVCSGDSGWSLIEIVNGVHILVGVTLFATTVESGAAGLLC